MADFLEDKSQSVFELLQIAEGVALGHKVDELLKFKVSFVETILFAEFWQAEVTQHIEETGGEGFEVDNFDIDCEHFGDDQIFLFNS